jgi:hypothetical protein
LWGGVLAIQFSISYADEAVVTADMKQKIMDEMLNPTVNYGDYDINGGKTNFDKLPMIPQTLLKSMVRVVLSHNQNQAISCVGVFITPNTILIADHCTWLASNKIPVSEIALAPFTPQIPVWSPMISWRSWKITHGGWIDAESANKDWALIKFTNMSFRGVTILPKKSILSSLTNFSKYLKNISESLVITPSSAYYIYYGGAQMNRDHNLMLQYYATSLGDSSEISISLSKTPNSVWNLFLESPLGFTQFGDSGAPLFFCATKNDDCILIGILNGIGENIHIRQWVPAYLFYSKLPS